MPLSLTRPSRSLRITTRASTLIATLAGLGACGGGGGDGPATAPSTTVSSTAIATSAVRFGQTITVAVSGSAVDTGLKLSSALCTNAVLSTTAPFVSTASTAYYQCTPAGAGAGEITVSRISDGALLATVALSIPVPQVSLAVDNGAGVVGTIVVTLAPDKAPGTVRNFLGYVNSGFYVNTIFHRVAPGFVVQGGGYVAPVGAGLPTLKTPGAPIALEAAGGLSNKQWAIAMARAGNVADSATSQFFIDLVDNGATLDASPVTGPGYAVFGNVTAGTGTVAAIAAAPCASLPLFLPTGECTPVPYLLVKSAVQTQ